MHARRLVEWLGGGSAESQRIDEAGLACHRPPLVSITCAGDQLTHLVTDFEFARAINAGDGVYQALCGAQVLVGSMSSAPGRQCTACRSGACPPTA